MAELWKRFPGDLPNGSDGLETNDDRTRVIPARNNSSPILMRSF